MHRCRTRRNKFRDDFRCCSKHCADLVSFTFSLPILWLMMPSLGNGTGKPVGVWGLTRTRTRGIPGPATPGFATARVNGSTRVRVTRRVYHVETWATTMLHKNDYAVDKRIASQPKTRTSLSSLMSASLAALSTSSSLTSPRRLQEPTHSNALVDWTESRLRTCGSKSRPRLNTLSTSTEVASNLCQYMPLLI
jgi:hypothetical protein